MNAPATSPWSPVATYRLQLTQAFTLVDAGDLVPYLARLGVDCLYTSPTLQAMPGSTSGYDVTDPTRINPELGGEEAHVRLSRRLAEYGLKRMVDIVPNHMAITGAENPWWSDVLKNGRSSQYATWFDVDWDASDALWPNRVLLPVLEDQFGRVLDDGRFRISHDQGRFTLHYHEKTFPVEPSSSATILARAANASGHPLLEFLAESLLRLPRPGISFGPEVARRHRHLAVLEELLATLCAENPALVAEIDAEVARVNDDARELGDLLERQNYRLAFWRAADQDLGYRRFFNINELAGLRVEFPEVFDTVQALPLQWIRDGEVHALRVDHPDGLRNPTAYFQRLRQVAPHAWIVAEKILALDEDIPDEWPVEGTTGYDFANLVQRLFLDPEGEAPLTNWYRDFTGVTQQPAELLFDAKRQVLADLLGSEVGRLASQLRDICDRHWRHRDHTRASLAQVLTCVIANFRVYRTYVRPDAPPSDEDRRRIHEAITATGACDPAPDGELLDFLERLLLMEVEGDLEREFVPRFQQLTGPAMAKGLEDTYLYRYLRLAALNEVGGDPDHWDISVGEFHQACTRMTRRPKSMLATSTHDTKRSEDVRTRLLVLSEMVPEWTAACTRWHEYNASFANGRLDPNTEYLYYQSLVGAWPIEQERMIAYMEKAAREAKAHTDWIHVNPEYERELRDFIVATMEDAGFMADVEALVARIALPGRVNSLAQMLVKLTAPGVPDIYQGCELWDHSLCDPDNRRPVDFTLRQRLLDELDTLTPDAIMQRMEEGLPKLWILREALRLRRDHPHCFAGGAPYRSLDVDGRRRAHVVGFVRGDEVAVVVPRLALSLLDSGTLGSPWGDWGDTRLVLPPGRWHNVLTDEPDLQHELPLARLLSRAPVALLARTTGATPAGSGDREQAS